MSGRMGYGDVALGVESAMPACIRTAPRARLGRRYLMRLLAALRRWA